MSRWEKANAVLQDLLHGGTCAALICISFWLGDIASQLSSLRASLEKPIQLVQTSPASLKVDGPSQHTYPQHDTLPPPPKRRN